eukprot:5526389-Pyramimonas_sp.AAC.2
MYRLSVDAAALWDGCWIVSSLLAPSTVPQWAALIALTVQLPAQLCAVGAGCPLPEAGDPRGAAAAGVIPTKPLSAAAAFPPLPRAPLNLNRTPSCPFQTPIVGPATNIIVLGNRCNEANHVPPLCTAHLDSGLGP